MDRHCRATGLIRANGAQYRAVERVCVIVGISLWFAVGVMWKDPAIMVVHIGAFIAIFAGYLNS